MSVCLHDKNWEGEITAPVQNMAAFAFEKGKQSFQKLKVGGNNHHGIFRRIGIYNIMKCTGI